MKKYESRACPARSAQELIAVGNWTDDWLYKQKQCVYMENSAKSQDRNSVTSVAIGTRWRKPSTYIIVTTSGDRYEYDSQGNLRKIDLLDWSKDSVIFYVMFTACVNSVHSGLCLTQSAFAQDVPQYIAMRQTPHHLQQSEWQTGHLVWTAVTGHPRSRSICRRPLVLSMNRTLCPMTLCIQST